MGRNLESPFIPSDAGSRPGLPFFSNSFLCTRPFLGEPSAVSCTARTLANSEAVFSIEAGLQRSQANRAHFSVLRHRFSLRNAFEFSDRASRSSFLALVT